MRSLGRVRMAGVALGVLTCVASVAGRVEQFHGEVPC
jgi:hypothetical protein